MPPSTPESGARIPGPELKSGLPSRDSRKDVVNAVRSTVRMMDQDILGLSTREDPANPSAELNRLKWIRESVVGAYQRTQESGKNRATFPNTFKEFTKGLDGQVQETGRTITLQEGIPVDDVLDYLRQKAEKLDWRDPKQAKEKQKLINQAHLLYRNGDPFYKVPGRFHTPPTEDELSVIYSRKQQEANLISKDYRATGSMEGDWTKAEEALAKRHELKISKARRKPRTKLTTGTETSITDTTLSEGIPEGTDLTDRTDVGEPDVEYNPDEDLTSEPDVDEPEEAPAPETPPAEQPSPTYNVIEAAEEDSDDDDEEEAPIVTTPPITVSPVTPTTPTPVTPTPTPVVITPTNIERTSLDVISEEAHIGKESSLEARKEINARLEKGKFWDLRRWPEKLALRLSQGGIENMRQERLRRALVDNNVSYMGTSSVTGAAVANNEALTQSEEQRNATLDRFRKGRIVEATNVNGQIIEARRIIEGPLKTLFMQDIIKPVIDGNITGTPREQANEIRRRMSVFIKDHLNDPQVGPQIRELFGSNASDYGFVAEYFATDVLEKAEVIKSNMEKHNLTLDQYSDYVDLHFGLARDSFNTDIRSLTDRVVAGARRRQSERLVRGAQEASRISGWIFNPAVVGIGMSLGTDGILRALGVATKITAVAGPLTGLLGGAEVAAIRRYHEIGGHLKMQNAELSRSEGLPERQRATSLIGKLYERTAGMYRREDLVQFRYDSVKTTDLINGTNGQEIPDPTDPNNPQKKRVMESVDQLLSLPLNTPQNREAVARRMEEIRTRINRGQIDRVDLLTYSSKTQTNQELNQLYDAADKLEQALSSSGTDTDALKSAAERYWQDAITLDKQRKDSAFNGYRWKQTAGAAVMGGTMGFLAGAGVQQGAAEIARHFSGAGALPVIGGMFKPGQTLAEKGVHAVGTAVGHPEIGTGPVNIIDAFTDLHNNGGRVDINNHVTAQVNPADKSMSILDRATGQPIPDQPNMITQANGHIIATGSLDHLPDEMKAWPSSETGLRSQIRDALNSGQPQTIPVGDANIDINGQNIDIRLDNEVVHGTVGTDATLHLSSDNLDSLKNTGGELLDHGFPDSKIVPTQSVLDQVKEALNQPGVDRQFITIKDLGEATITPATGEISIYPSSGLLSGQEIHGIFSPDKGSFHLDLPPNSNLNLHAVQQTLENAGFTGVKVEDIPGQTSEIPGKTITQDALDHFREQNMVEKAKRLFWHDNNTTMHLNERGILVGADGKELQLHHFLQNDGTVTLDMSQMVSQMTPQGGVNWDLTVDSQYSHLLKDIVVNPDGSRTYQNFEFLITPNDAADNAREIIKIPVTGNGNFGIQSDSDLHQFFDTASGKPVQLARFIEVAHVEPDGTRTILATSVGKGIDQITTVTPPEQVITPGIHTLDAIVPDTHTYNLDLTPPHATEIIPPTVESPPFIPIPFERMHPLPPTTPPPTPPIVPPEPPYGYGYGYGAGDEAARRRLSDLTRETTDTDDESQLPGLLNQAFVLWGVAPNIQQNLRGLTPPEQRHWLQQQIIAAQPTLAPRTNQLSIQEMADILTDLSSARQQGGTTPPIPVPPPVINTTNPDNRNVANQKELIDYIADVNNLKVPPEFKDDAIAEAQTYIESSEIQNAESRGGLSQTEAAALYKDMIIWRSSHNLTDLSKDDSSFSSNPLYAQITALAEMGLWISDPAEVRRTANAIMRFINEYGGKYNLTGKGDVEANLAVITIAFGGISKIPVASSTP